MLTWPRQLPLSRFHTAAVGKAQGVRPEEGGRHAQNQLWLLEAVLGRTYRGSHFSTADKGRRILESCIQLMDT